MISKSAFYEIEFFAVILFSFFIPAVIYTYMMRAKTISRYTVLTMGIILIILAAADVALLGRLTEIARISTSSIDNDVFSSQISIALYIVPAVLVGIGTNLISHVLIRHLKAAERRFEIRRHGQ